MRRHLVPILAAAALLAAAAGPLRAQQPAESAAFLVRLGTDTVAVERFTRTATRLEGELAIRAPRASYRRYAADIGINGSVTRFEVTMPRIGAPADAPAPAGAVASFAGDSVHLEVRRGDTLLTAAVAVGLGTLPVLGGAYAPYELVTARALQSRRDSVAVPTYPVGTRSAVTTLVRRLGRDSALIVTPGATWRAAVDANGRILGLRAPGTTSQIQLERLDALDVAALAQAWAARDAQGQGMGTLSPRDTVRAVVAGDSLLVDYGRPRKRGREIFGNVVAWGQVWRTGANAATQFRTTRDLAFGALVVPAGTYTLWTLPTPSGWQLIVNRQTGQWGTEYHPEQDLGRVAMSVAALAEPVEAFTIAVEPQGAGGLLVLTWDRTRVQVPFTVR